MSGLPYRALARGGVVAVVLVGWLVLASALGQPVSKVDHRPGDGAQSATKPQENAPVPPVTLIENAIDRVAKALETQNADANSNEERDLARQNLEAQQNMATWARNMFWVGLGEAIVTFFGVVLVGFTLHATRRAAIAAENAVTETRRIGEAQTRAYLTIKQASVVFQLEAQTPLVTFIATNSGQSPARNFIWNVTVQYPDSSIRKAFIFYERWFERTGMDIPATSDSTPESAWVVASAKAAIEMPHPGTMVTVIRVKIDFRFTDVFEHDWAGEAYFAGTMRKQPVTPEGLKSGAPRWAAALEPLPKPTDWDSIPTEKEDERGHRRYGAHSAPPP